MPNFGTLKKHIHILELSTMIWVYPIKYYHGYFIAAQSYVSLILSKFYTMIDGVI